MREQLKTIVDADSIYFWENLDSINKEIISKAIAEETRIDSIIYPKNREELAAVMGLAFEKEWPVLIGGGRSKVSWGGLVQGARLVVGSDRLNRLIEHAVGDLTVTVEAGMRFGELQQILAKEGQFVPLDPAYPDKATIGGIVATGDTGSWRQRYRGVRDLLLGISFVRGDGKIAKAGGRVVKNVAGYDLMKLLTGSYGTLGVINEVTLRTYPLPEASATVVLVGESDAIFKASQTLLSSALTPVAFDLLSRKLVEKLDLGKGMGLMVRFQTVAESVKQQSERLLAVGEKLGLSANLAGYNEAELWEKLQQYKWEDLAGSEVVCKIGVIPTEAVATLNKLERGIGLIHASVGLGVLRFDSISGDELLKLRGWCENQGGFLTVLFAPVEIKQNLDIWGYNSNALNLMRQIKQQFDSKNILNPQRCF